MFKIITDINQLTAINNAVKLKEQNNDSIYCEIDKHCKNEMYAIPIMRDYLKNLGLDFITDNWLNSNIVETLSTDWSWLYTDRLIRVSIPFNLQAKAQVSKAKKTKEDNKENNSSKNEYQLLGELLTNMLPLIPEYMIINGGDYITIYLEELYPEHEMLLRSFSEIIIENKQLN